MSTYSIRLASLSAHTSGASTSGGTRTHTPQRIPDFESGASTNSATEAKEKRGAETNTRDNHATTVRPTSGAHAHQPHHRPAQPACADTLNRPTQTGPNFYTNTESTLAQTPKRHPHTPSAPSNAATHPCVTAPAAALCSRVVSAPRSA